MNYITQVVLRKTDGSAITLVLKSSAFRASRDMVQALVNQSDLQSAHHLCFAHVIRYPEDKSAKLVLQTISQKRLLTVNQKKLVPHLEQVKRLLNQQEDQQALNLIELLLADYGRAPAILYVLTQALQALKLIDDYEMAVRELLTLVPGSGVLHLGLANALQKQQRLREAVDEYRVCLQFDVDNAAALANLGVTLGRLRRLKDARSSFEQSLKIRPNHVLTLNNYGKLLFDYGFVTEARQLFENGLLLDPDNDHISLNLGHVSQMTGDIERASSLYSRVSSTQRFGAEAFYNLALINRLDSKSEQIDQAIDAVRETDRPTADRIHCAFGLGHWFHALNAFESAFQYFALGNQLKAEVLAYDHSRDAQLMDTLRQQAEAFMDDQCNLAVSQDAPTLIFIVGMPRSGSTLLEHVLTCSKHVSSGGEMPWIPEYGRELATGQTRPTPSALQEFRGRVLVEIQARGLHTPYVIDKLPSNFKYLSLIMAAFPDALCINTVRDPRAVGWSIFKHLFAGDAQPYGYALDTIVSYWMEYQNMMAFWDQSPIAGSIHHFEYEALVNETEPAMHSLVEQLGIPWTDAFLRPELNARAVQTASSLQVRSPIARHASNAWRRYESFLPEEFVELPWKHH